MFNLPSTTEIHKQLPKKAFYAKFNLNTAQKNAFDADISRIDIVSAVSRKTVPGLADNDDFKEFYLLTVQLKHKNYDDNNINLLFKSIPQRMVLALQFEDKTQLVALHLKVFKSEWKNTDDFSIPLSGLNLFEVWTNVIRYVGNLAPRSDMSLDQQIFWEELISKLKKQLASLEKQLRNTKQPKKKAELFDEIKSLKQRLNEENENAKP